MEPACQLGVPWLVAGVDFGTLSVRVSIFDSARGRLGSGIAEYPLHRKKDDPDHATQSHADHMNALAAAMQPRARATPASTAGDDRSHRARHHRLQRHPRRRRTSSRSTTTTSGATIAPGKKPPKSPPPRTHSGLAAIDWCGGIYSSEWGFAKLLHWLRHNPEKRAAFATALEHCDMVAAVLCGITDPAEVPRSICAMGHKWMWNASLGGLPPEEFLTARRPAARRRPRQTRRPLRRRPTRSPATSRPNGPRSSACAPASRSPSAPSMRTGTPSAPACASATWSTWSAPPPASWPSANRPALIPGVCGVVPGSIHPDYTGIEAGLSATGDIFDAIARRAGTTVAELSAGPRTAIAPARPACCASPGTTATAPCW